MPSTWLELDKKRFRITRKRLPVRVAYIGKDDKRRVGETRSAAAAAQSRTSQKIAYMRIFTMSDLISFAPSAGHTVLGGLKRQVFLVFF